MTRDSETQENHVRVKPPYDKRTADFMYGNIESGLKLLKDLKTGKSRYVNYEDLCNAAISNIDSPQYLEWHLYWRYWQERFSRETAYRNRRYIFHELLTDLIAKGFIGQEISGLTGNISGQIKKILAHKGSRT